jgi:hypothetical protein
MFFVVPTLNPQAFNVISGHVIHDIIFDVLVYEDTDTSTSSISVITYEIITRQEQLMIMDVSIQPRFI